ncbi:hypothetical protein HY212_07795 [Candidatus Pacearchaeota archaeon]|nr:hypothetical protein [Candidatus Pacearchaeota archaeon]
MPKTIKDCLLEGGIKGKVFRFTNDKKKPVRYLVKDIIISWGEVDLYAECLEGSIDPMLEVEDNHYLLRLSLYTQDQLVEEPSSVLPIPLPAPQNPSSS